MVGNVEAVEARFDFEKAMCSVDIPKRILKERYFPPCVTAGRNVLWLF